MSKGNIFLGLAAGKLGDVVLYRAQGEQIARARNRNPKNPQSGLQMVQRSMMKTTALAYSLLQPIADHSFQGLQEGTPNQSRFTVRNIALMREQIETALAKGDDTLLFNSEATNFAGKFETQPVIRPYVISEGNLPKLQVSIDAGMPCVSAPGLLADQTYSYSFIINALGLKQGDQLTFCFLYTDDTTAANAGTFTSFDYARVILEPASGDMTSDFLTSDDFSPVDDANEKNMGSVYFVADDNRFNFLPTSTRAAVQGDKSRSLAAVAVIVSRFENGAWRRSSSQLVLMPQTGTAATGLMYPYDKYPLGDAARSWLKGEQSSLYLNQAG